MVHSELSVIFTVYQSTTHFQEKRENDQKTLVRDLFCNHLCSGADNLLCSHLCSGADNLLSNHLCSGADNLLCNPLCSGADNLLCNHLCSGADNLPTGLPTLEPVHRNVQRCSNLQTCNKGSCNREASTPLDPT